MVTANDDGPTGGRPAPDTALAIPVPDLAPMLERVAARWPDAVRDGVPPHVSVAYPFLARSALDDDIRDRVAGIARAHALGPVELGAPQRAPGIVYSAPSPRGPVDALVAAVEREWAEVAGEHAARAVHRTPIGPHLTIALGADEVHDDVVALAADWFPRHVVLDDLWLSVREATGWTFRASFPLGPGAVA